MIMVQQHNFLMPNNCFMVILVLMYPIVIILQLIQQCCSYVHI